MNKKLFLLLAATALTSVTLAMPGQSFALDNTMTSKPPVVRVDDELDLDFDLVNETGYAISAVYLSPTSVEEWGPNIAPDDLPSGASGHIHFSPGATAAKWDLKVDWADGSPSSVWTELDLTEISTLTLHYDRETDTATAHAE
ncbi:hypothetical protein COW36_09645 [bacterium (Candidatus Blackallbacteria) CG17_big_fil_post_rev_8_21_14_2_50_48_46]|uniref:Argininosuccinate lyase n=1 Tax=bacterium (Candidatus Blackallbacteria) CG17_big_fil_post_rev_8_21_14_2_50_48_46 TaxID=2014261 RepID=A0A2M7G5I7_9BACT|nr:MAG: hypothetical protein COW64_01765 [bacterium (Candidatus Blackallbacteria) CG18_big_fil_WC_8_21_14_2_50_49_26]PIW17225.1 MAG: hypothetical protein COW36_09645 [bacterium (Candidatus Blackallbacteria) CG17_big_fil_post_rev_8_21_14_2_50_48_46]PIW51016.1 MAG: hypothetical protein COW20_00655 [bacterium (Candidatus Blackallbacteria) CG13_big_fil_rev_8_21_14_2_50_49_14]